MVKQAKRVHHKPCNTLTKKEHYMVGSVESAHIEVKKVDSETRRQIGEDIWANILR